jgi:hypothetical protein
MKCGSFLKKKRTRHENTAASFHLNRPTIAHNWVRACAITVRMNKSDGEMRVNASHNKLVAWKQHRNTASLIRRKQPLPKAVSIPGARERP